MSNQPSSQQHEMSLKDMLFDCLDNSTCKEKLLELTQAFKERTDLHNDTSALQSIAILEFLSQQIQGGNSDIVSPEIIQASCKHILERLLPDDRLISYRLFQQEL